MINTEVVFGLGISSSYRLSGYYITSMLEPESIQTCKFSVFSSFCLLSAQTLTRLHCELCVKPASRIRQACYVPDIRFSEMAAVDDDLRDSIAEIVTDVETSHQVSHRRTVLFLTTSVGIDNLKV